MLIVYSISDDVEKNAHLRALEGAAAARTREVDVGEVDEVVDEFDPEEAITQDAGGGAATAAAEVCGGG